MHSSRMRTTRFSSHLYGGCLPLGPGGVCLWVRRVLWVWVQGDVCLDSGAICLWVSTTPPGHTHPLYTRTSPFHLNSVHSLEEN